MAVVTSDAFDWHEDGLTVGEVRQRMQIAASAVRYYADQGLLPHKRNAANQRQFHADVLCRVAMIQAAQHVGLSLTEIRDVLAVLPPGQAPTAEDWQHLSEHLKQVLTGRIDEMFVLLDDLAASVGDSVIQRVQQAE